MRYVKIINYNYGGYILSKIDNLKKYVKTIRDGVSTKVDFEKFNEDIENIKPVDAFQIFHSLLEEGNEADDILAFLDKVINVFYHSLLNYQIKDSNYEFLNNLIYENNKLKNIMDEIKQIIKMPSWRNEKDNIFEKINELKDFHKHYTIIQNIIFPFLEKKEEKFEGTSIMWALHDEVKKYLDDLYLAVRDNKGEKEVNICLGNVFFGYLGLVQKEELILFPSAVEVLDDKDWKQMHRQSLDYEWAFVDIAKYEKEVNNLEKIDFSDKKIKAETGNLDVEQLLLILNSLTIDLTYVDENNKVRFFTKPKDRFFPRSPAIIGRDVKNCHPPASVHIVEEILDSFKSGEKDKAKFWINIKDKTILIQYFALRNEKEEYKGTLEISQDVTEIKGLSGEKRLLDW